MKKLLIIILLISSIGFAQEKTNSEAEIINAFSKANNNVGVLVLIKKNNNTTTYTAGYSNHEQQTKANDNDLFEIGSATKIFTAAAILQLIEDGKLSLKTTLNTIYPEGDIKGLANYKGKNYWNKVTVQMLLNHTSGFIDYLNVFSSDEEALKIFGGSNKNYSFEDITKLAINHGDANFIPGEKFEYSNTNYTILGDIITKISKTPWRNYIEKNIFKKAGLNNTFFGSRITPENRKKLMTGYYKDQITSMPYTLAGSAGEIISNLADLNTFLEYWNQGKFFKKPETYKTQISKGVHNMYPNTDILKYALGTMILNEIVGHGGQTFGFQSYLGIHPKTGSIYIIGINNAAANSMQLLFNLIRNK